MNIKERINYDFPSYAITALIYGDYSCMNEEDEKNLNEFLEREKHIDHWHGPLTPGSFSQSPEFGLACHCVKIEGIIWDK